MSRARRRRSDTHGSASLLCLLATLTVPASASAIEPDMPTIPDITPADTQAAEEGQPLGLECAAWWQRFYDRLDASAPDRTAPADVGRLVLDFRREFHPSTKWRIGVSNRLEGALDLTRPSTSSARGGGSNNLRELWVGWKGGTADQMIFVDAGRINMRNGVGVGYNPTDFFKTGAVRTATLLDPNALRLDRLGTVMVTGQYLGKSGAWTASIAPQLTRQDPTEKDPWYSPALSHTNNRLAFLVKWAPQVHERLSLDVLAFYREGNRPKLGLNLSLLLGSAVVGNAELTSGMCQPLLGPTDLPARGAWSWCAQGAVNLTWTTPLRLELAVEYHFATDALSATAWRAWREVSSADLEQRLDAMVAERDFQREPLVRSGGFVRAAWRDAFSARGLELSGFVQVNAFDGSGLAQLAASMHFSGDWSLSLQLLDYFGGSRTEFGSAPYRWGSSLWLSKLF